MSKRVELHKALLISNTVNRPGAAAVTAPAAVCRTETAFRQLFGRASTGVGRTRQCKTIVFNLVPVTSG